MATPRVTLAPPRQSAQPASKIGASMWAILNGLLPIFLLYAGYTLLRWSVAEHGAEVGLGNAEDIIHLEQNLRIYHEQPIQQFALKSVDFITIANWYYVIGFLPVLLGAASLAAIRVPQIFRWWRGVFAISMVLALIGYTLYPLAPPRLLPSQYGFVDTLLAYGPHYYGDATGSSVFNGYGSMPSAVNVYAAMPSMHVAWSVVAAILFAAAFGYKKWAVALAVIHPIAMAITVTVTANHFFLDVLVGLLVLAISVPLARFIRGSVASLSARRV